MSKNSKISVAIVLYNEEPIILQKTIDCVLQCKKVDKLYLLDNSSKPSNLYKENSKVNYQFLGKNIGFGKAHNLVLEEIKMTSTHHLILNPDVIFKEETLEHLVSTIENQGAVAMIAPKVLYPNGALQYTARKDPRFLELIFRRLGIRKNFVQAQEYRSQLEQAFFPDFIHGCFMLFKTKDLIDINGFDERYFLYMEDADICRKIRLSKRKLMYDPTVNITHIHRKGSAKQLKLVFYHLISAIKYFYKWCLLYFKKR